MSLPADLMMRVCRFLYPRDLLALARTSKKLRAKFMKETSEPFWNATRYLTGMPDWRTVGFPQAAAMVYDSECQGWSCSEESSVMAFHVCRRYCLKCAQENLLDLKEVLREFPSVPEDLVKRLPWTARRTPSPIPKKKRFYLKSDVQKFCQRWDAVKPLDGKSMDALGQELSAFRRRRETSTKEVQSWYKRDLRERQKRLNQRWTIIADVMKSRWGWKPIEYDRLGLRLRQIVDYLLDLPTLSEQAWAYVRDDLEWVIKEEARIRSRNHDTRRFSLRVPSEK
ncbi:hypothetical protein M407DRAFT_25619 [Tulasnella calospora MUT 4182]|uniref:F-box domain-containing protein n=1 Tax=Tulasnella calospora MUT 4182 TaxID=1051891 RepID=A0A0C3QFW0_9AGAM|nr:hypothetical protein M407DRAFT_25619 [Tulasnella calospora MUT 4182]